MWDADGAIVNMLFYPACATVWEQCVLHGGSSKRLAPPRNTKDRKHLQSTQSTVNRHTSQTTHQALSKGQPGRHITPINTVAVNNLCGLTYLRNQNLQRATGMSATSMPNSFPVGLVRSSFAFVSSIPFLLDLAAVLGLGEPRHIGGLCTAITQSPPRPKGPLALHVHTCCV